MTKIKDGVFGLAIGDAMGVPIEFVSRERLIANPLIVMRGFGTHQVPAGSWSDDTSMTIATMDSIANKKGVDYKDIMDSFYEWVVNYKYTSCGIRFDIGETCAQSILNYTKENKNPLDCGLNDIYDNGNGSLMRILPVTYLCYYNNYSEKETIKLVNEMSSLTHAHEISKLGCYIYVRYVMMLLSGMEKKEAYNNLKKLDYSSYGKDSIEKYNRILEEDLTSYELDDIKSTGYVVDTLEASLWTFLNTNSFKHAIVGSINLGDDTDTVGAITGSMAGIYYGYNSIPNEWLDKLLKKDYLERICEKFEEAIIIKKKSAILGAIIGDVAGSRFELNDCKDIHFELLPKTKCRFTDDSVLTLAVADTLLKCKGKYDDLSNEVTNNMVKIGNEYIECGFGPSFYNWLQSEEHHPYNSYGNGAAMRSSACGLFANSIEEVKDITYKVTAISHNHPDAIKGSESVAMMVYLIKEGNDKEYLKNYFEENYYSLDYDIEKINSDFRYKISCEATVPQSFKAFYESNSFEEAIRKSIMLGGDSDTIASICGVFAGMYYGVPEYLEKQVLEFLSKDLLDIYKKVGK